MKRAIYITLTALALIILASNIPTDPYRSILELHEKKLIGISGVGRGGYNSTCISLMYNNPKTDTLFARVEPGTIFISDDASQQDILVTRGDQFVAHPKSSGEMVAWGYCCRATRAAPKQGNKFSHIKEAQDTLLRLAQYLSTNFYSIDAEQHAVWVISNGNPVASIPEGAKRENVPLRKKVCGLIGQEYPWYTIEYVKSDMPFSGNPQRIYGEIAYQIATSCLVDVVLYREDGTKLKTLMQGMPAQPGRRTYWFDEKNIFSKGETYTLKFYYDRAERYSTKIKL